MSKATILIVEDDYDILNANRSILELEGYHVLEADTLEKGRMMVGKYSPDLIILDVMLPDGNGLSYCEEIRSGSGIRIMFLSALGTKADVLAGLRAGGDDYIAKPYDMDELILRVDVLLRRGKLIEMEEPPMVLGKLVLNHYSRRALLMGRDILLKPKEFSLLYVLASNPVKIFTAAELYKKVWGADEYVDEYNETRTVTEHISRIRKKLGAKSGISIVTERGKGYHLELIELS